MAVDQVPTEGSRHVKPDNNWEAIDDARGFLFRPLLTTPDLTTMLMRVEPGAYADMHAHEGVEQIYVLDGSFYDDAGEHSAGSYIVRSPGTLHVGGSRIGATLLLVYSGGSM